MKKEEKKVVKKLAFCHKWKRTNESHITSVHQDWIYTC